MYRRFFLAILASGGLVVNGFAAVEPSHVGVVDFAVCITDSKLGKQEQSSFDGLKKQMTTLLEDTDKQLREITDKIHDQEYMDGLSPEAEHELHEKLRLLQEDMQRYQNQCYQVLNQANMRVIQTLSEAITKASDTVAKNKKLLVVMNKEACFFFSPLLEVTRDVILEMDRSLDAREHGVAKDASSPSQKS